MRNDPTTVPATFADMVKLQPRLADLEADCLKAAKNVRARSKDWFWYQYLKPRLNDLVGFEPRHGASIPEELETPEAHRMAYQHLYSLLHTSKAKLRQKRR